MSNSPIVTHVAFNKMSRSQRRHQWQLARQHGATDHAGQLTGVLTRLVGAGTLNAEHLKVTDENLHGQAGGGHR